MNSRKALKKRIKRKKYERTRNILRQWQREENNRLANGLAPRRMPIKFPQSKK